jgi:transposase-like protein
MSEDTIVSFSSPAFDDQLSEMLQAEARRMIAAAVAGELSDFLVRHAPRRDAQGRRAIVRNGYQPERRILTGVGEVAVKIPKTRDRSGAGMGFRLALVPPYLEKTHRVEEVLPCLYLAGLSTNDFPTALEALFGEWVRGLSANSIARLKRS